MSDKWTMFKNYMHNELHITKDDIRVWIREAVNEEARKLIQNTYDKYSLEKILKDLVEQQITGRYGLDYFNDDVRKEVAKILAKNIQISLKKTNN